MDCSFCRRLAAPAARYRSHCGARLALEAAGVDAPGISEFQPVPYKKSPPGSALPASETRLAQLHRGVIRHGAQLASIGKHAARFRTGGKHTACSFDMSGDSGDSLRETTTHPCYRTGGRASEADGD